MKKEIHFKIGSAQQKRMSSVFYNIVINFNYRKR